MAGKMPEVIPELKVRKLHELLTQNLKTLTTKGQYPVKVICHH